MKKSDGYRPFALLFLILPPLANACGDESLYPEQYGLIVALILAYISAMLLPLAGIITTLAYNRRTLMIVWFSSFAATIASFIVLFAEIGRYVNAAAIITLALSLFMPTGYYFFKALKKSRAV